MKNNLACVGKKRGAAGAFSLLPIAPDMDDKTIEEWRGDFIQIDDICIIGARA